MILFLDDIRDITDVVNVKYRERFNLPYYTESQLSILRGYTDKTDTVRSYAEAVRHITTKEFPEMIFFDNDLGFDSLEGYDFLKWLLNRNPPKFEAYFHTANPVARNNMQSLYNNYSKEFWNAS